MNWSYSNKVGIDFAMYQQMISKETSWAVPRHVSGILELGKSMIDD